MKIMKIRLAMSGICRLTGKSNYHLGLWWNDKVTQHLTARDLEIKVNDGLDALQLGVSQSDCPGVTKERWPELLGVPAKLAKELIQKDNSRLTNIPIVLNGSPVTLDFRCDRVRLFCNIFDVVVDTPQVG